MKEADFINCVVFRRPAENVNNYLSKGSLAGVEGRLQSRSYENQEGRRVYVTEVVCDSVQFLEPKGANQRQSGNDNQSYNQNNNEFQNYGQDFGGNQQQGQKHLQINSQIINNQVIHLQTLMAQLISVMMICRSNS